MNREDGAFQALKALIALGLPSGLDPEIDSPSLMRLYYKVFEEAGNTVLAIFDLKIRTIHDHEALDQMAELIPEEMISQVAKIEKVRMIHHKDIISLLNEQHVEGEMEQDYSDRVLETVKLMGATALLRGSLTYIDQQILIYVEVVDVKTGVIDPVRIKGKEDEFLDLVEELGRRIAEKISAMADDTLVEAHTRKLSPAFIT